jgi:hypothetical protein
LRKKMKCQLWMILVNLLILVVSLIKCVD